MKVVSFVCAKGGCGKSMLAINLAVAAGAAGEKVALVDLDPQGTVLAWGRTRTVESPAVLGGPVQLHLADLIKGLIAEGFTLAVLDTKGEESHATRGAMAAADLCLIPSRPAGPDLHAIRPTMEALRRMGKDFALVVNQALPNKRARLTAAIMTSLSADATVLPLAVASRAAFQKAYSLGQGVGEFEGEGAAAEEMAEVWAWTRKHLAAAGEGFQHVAAG